MDFTNPTAARQQAATETDQGLRSYMLQIYNYMASALSLTGIVAWFSANSPAIMGVLYTTTPEGMMALSGLGWLVTFAPLGFIFFLGFRIQKMSLFSAQAVFWAFAAVMGLSLSSIFLAYTGASIARTFFITAIMFGSMSLYGYTTKRDLTGMGSFLIMGMWGLFICFIVNIFLRSPMFDLVLSAIGVLVFTGLAAYDTQKLKNMYYQLSGYGEMMSKMVIMGALNLYLDFINLFIMLLRFVGERR